MASVIKTTLRSAAIALITAGGFSGLYRMRAGRSAPLLRVLNFHDVPDIVRFANILDVIRSQYHVVTPEACFSQCFDPSRVNILITFDDGYASWIEVAQSLMSPLDIKALFFVNSGLLDAHGDEAARRRYVKDRLLISPRETLSWDGLRALHAAGHTIGGHTTSHPRLSTLQQHELHAEIIQDKRRIETMLHTEITTFAYPFGEHTLRVEMCLRYAGYKHAFANEPCFATLDHPLHMTRMPIEETDSIMDLRHAVEGSCDVYENMTSLFRLQQRTKREAGRTS